MYQIEFKPRARKDFLGLPPRVQERLRVKIEALTLNPRPHGAIKLQGDEAYRLRDGDYRLIYDIEDKKLLILILAVGHRKDIYR